MRQFNSATIQPLIRPLGALALALAVAAPAARAGTTYDAVKDFTLSDPNGAWSYGTNHGSSLSLFTETHSMCFSEANIDCQTDSGGASSVPLVGAVTSGSSASPVGTITIPSDVLWMHPDSGDTAASDTSVVFTAPTSGVYSVSGYFERLSTSDNGNGVLVNIYDNGASIYSGSLTTLTYGSEATFSQNVTLATGDLLSFTVNNNGEYSYDSTGLSASIAAVPEPGAWALMLAGVAMAGASLRLKRRSRGDARA